MLEKGHSGGMGIMLSLSIATLIIFSQSSALALTKEGGYPSSTSVVQGGSIDFHISTWLPKYTIRVYRNGVDRELMLTIPNLPGHYYDCTDKYDVGCGWPVAYTLEIPEDWPGDMYEADFDAYSPNVFTTIRFVVKEDDPGSTSNMLVVVPVNNFNAYTRYGGKSLYLPLFNPTHVVSFERPLQPQADHTTSFVDWAEKDYNVEYATDIDFHSDPDLLSNYQCYIVSGHSEYWTRDMRKNLDAFTDSGGSAIIMAGNTSWWQVRISDDLKTMTGYKYWASYEDPYALDNDTSNDYLITARWSSRFVNWPETETTGLSFDYGGYHDDYTLVTPYTYDNGFCGYKVYRTDDWVFDGTDLTDGTMIGRDATIVGYEVDGTLMDARFPDGSPGWDADGFYPLPGALPYVANASETGTPENFVILGVAPASADHAVMGYFEKPSGGIVFNAGTIDWTDGLDSDPYVTQITENVVNRLCKTHPGLDVEVKQASRHWFAATMYGSEKLDVSDVDARSLRLSGARPLLIVRHKFLSRDDLDLDEDGFPDIVAIFYLRHSQLRDLDEQACLSGEISSYGFLDCVPFEKWEPHY
jgi:hypothetical protein